MPAQKEAKIAPRSDRAVVAAKENMPPKKSKATISVASLFQPKQDLRRRAEKHRHDVLAPKSAGVFKSRASRKSEQHPLYMKFLEHTKDYRHGVNEARGDELKPVYEELVASVDALAVAGAHGDITGGSSNGSTSAIALEYARLAKPLGEDKIEIQRTKADGTKIAQERKLSDTMSGFERVLEQKRTELEQLLRELAAVDADLAAAKQDVLAVEQKEVNALKRDLDTQVASLLRQAGACREATQAEVNKARKDEKKAKEVQAKKFEQFMKSMF